MPWERSGARLGAAGMDGKERKTAGFPWVFSFCVFFSGCLRWQLDSWLMVLVFLCVFLLQVVQGGKWIADEWMFVPNNMVKIGFEPSQYLSISINVVCTGCQSHHPKVITMFVGGMFTIPEG